ncbi:Uu.00g098530.m01.CDS01 [Anthostomella pinea]|uniref:Uu.00g098530.m01.CDS01 n=1 Tax=Anthostomella pinea TaxID=933095 RepID=A0AAI8VCM3_9PEZI|nr:Uu.00g098530.m01.CDS01 [Anthostomella pinea]
MGLPLFIAPVESDIPSKPAAKSSADPVHARSPIRRRSDPRRQPSGIERHRQRLLAALQNQDGLPAPLAAARADAVAAQAHQERRSPLDDSEALSDLLFVARGHESEREPERVRPRRAHNLYEPESDELIPWTYRAADMVPPLAVPLANPARSSRAATSAFARLDPPGYSSVRVAARPSLHREQDDQRRRMMTQLETERMRRRSHRHIQRNGQRVRYVDGLGDRDRSLSPEGDGVWDTLQSTLTPDPQPPSVGSSFASANASTAASQSNMANSSNTSITSPEDMEPPCDPVDTQGDDNGEADDIEGRHAGSSLRPTPRERRSYANVAAELDSWQSAEDSENPEADREWLSGMHRIVSGLATREDIPDEWWAQAGLSRSMSWEESN